MVIKNKRAYFDYEILKKYEAGIALTGAEVKAVKNSQVSLRDSFVRIMNNEAWLWNADISKYKYSNDMSFDSVRSRKLLLRRKEIDEITGKMQQKGFTVVPLSLFTAHGLIKVEIALAKGKKQYQKKEREKERTLDRELHREKRKFMVE